MRRWSRSCSSGVYVAVGILPRFVGTEGTGLAISASLKASVLAAAITRARASPSKALGVLNILFPFLKPFFDFGGAWEVRVVGGECVSA